VDTFGIMLTALSVLALASSAAAASWSVVSADVATVATGIDFVDSNTGEATSKVDFVDLRQLPGILEAIFGSYARRIRLSAWIIAKKFW